MLQRKTVTLGDPTPVRDLLYVDDHVNSYVTCLEDEKAIGQTCNFCTGHGVSIAQLANQIKELVNFKGEIIWNTIPERPLDVATLIGDNSKAQQLLGWKPKFTLKKGLQLTIDFWKTRAEN